MLYSSPTRGVVRLIGIGLLSACFLVPAVTYAQLATTTVTGIVSDDSGNLLSGSTILATNAETGWQRSAVSDPRGSYRISSLPFGIYDLSCEIPGVALQTQKAI